MKKIKVFFCMLLVLFIISIICCSNVFASTNRYSFVAGINGEKYVPEAIVNVSDNVSDMGYTVDLVCGPSYEYINGNINSAGLKRLAANVMCFIGHGNAHEIYVKMDNSNRVYISTYPSGISENPNGMSYYRKGIQDMSVAYSKLIVYAGCSTASATDSLPDATVDKGAFCSMGWTSTVYFIDLNDWLKEFFRYLQKDYTIEQANLLANSKTYYYDNSIKNVRYCGVTDITINLIRSYAYRDVEREDMFRPLKLNGEDIAFDNTEQSIEKLNNFLLSTYDNFNPDEYKASIMDYGNGNYIVTLDKNIGNFKTNANYVLTIYKGLLTNVETSNTDLLISEDQVNDLLNYYINEDIIENFKQKAIENITNHNEMEIINQSVEFEFDIQNNKKIIKIATTYLNEFEQEQLDVYKDELINY